jgi:ABC-type multidrug transport system permease subunit
MKLMRLDPFYRLLTARIREPLREPEVVFWVFVFPILLAVGLGIAFRNKPQQQISVAVADGTRASEVATVLKADPQLVVRVSSEEEARSELRLGKVALVVVPGDAYEYRFDPTRPEAELARSHVEGVLQKAAGREDAFEAVEVEVSEPGARYIDFLIPGLLGMNLMSGGLWGVGFAVVDMRTRKLLKRLVASPMRKSEFIAAVMMSRVVFMLIELVALLVFGYFVFDIVVRGSILATVLVGFLGALTFGGIGILVASRAQKIETVSGLMNLVMLPMFVFSGIFFSADRFPDVMQPAIQALPLTMLNDALRAIIIEGQSLASQAREILGLLLWGGLSFLLSIKWFRWT